MKWLGAEAPTPEVTSGHLAGEANRALVCYHENASAGVTQLVEYLLPKQKVAGSSPVSRSNASIIFCACPVVFTRVDLWISVPAL
jgi:hypothetical protein